MANSTDMVLSIAAAYTGSPEAPDELNVVKT